MLQWHKVTWRALAAVPANVLQVTVLCNDCSQRTDCNFHVVGHKCGDCGGYNTRRVGGGPQQEQNQEQQQQQGLPGQQLEQPEQ